MVSSLKRKPVLFQRIGFCTSPICAGMVMTLMRFGMTRRLQGVSGDRFTGKENVHRLRIMGF